MEKKINIFVFFFLYALILFLGSLFSGIFNFEMGDLKSIFLTSKVLFSPFKNELYKIPVSFSNEFESWLNLAGFKTKEIFEIPIIYHPFIYLLFYPLIFVPYKFIMFIFTFLYIFLLFKIFKKCNFNLNFISFSLIYFPIREIFLSGALDLILIFATILLLSSKDDRFKGFLISFGFILKPQFFFLLPVYYLIKKRFKILIFFFLFYVIFSIFSFLILGKDILIIYLKSLLFYSKNIVLSCENISFQSFLAKLLNIAPFVSSHKLFLLPEEFIIFIRILSLIFLIINIYAWLKQKDEFKNIIFGVFTGFLISPLFWLHYLAISILLLRLFDKEDNIFKLLFLFGVALTAFSPKPFLTDFINSLYLFTGMILIYLSIFYTVFKNIK